MWWPLIASFYKILINSLTKLLALYHVWFLVFYSLHHMQLSGGIKWNGKVEK